MRDTEFAAVRNAGGRVAQVEREIAFATAAADVKEVIVIHHKSKSSTCHLPAYSLPVLGYRL